VGLPDRHRKRKYPIGDRRSSPSRGCTGSDISCFLIVLSFLIGLYDIARGLSTRYLPRREGYTGVSRDSGMVYLGYMGISTPRGYIDMSTNNEIRAVYDWDIGRMTDDVVSRKGLMALYEDLGSLPSIQNVWPEEFLDLCEAVVRADDITPASSGAISGLPINWQG
jgi:hypothetical protein